ncbi:MAG TPA: glycosyltransferase family 2 protein [Flexilinea sp.]|nr:glycosyltransferase family 2 protein [Flexilinea sp.]
MQTQSQLTIVIPAFNEEKSLQTFLPQVLNYCDENHFRLIIVNDASTDRTAEVLDHFQNQFPEIMKIVNHKVNKGYGGALSTGLKQAETPFVVTLDADGQHRLEDVTALMQEQQRTNADLVIGRRPEKINGDLQQSYRSLGKKLIRRVAKMMMDVPVRDLNSGLKLYNTELVQKYLPVCPESMAFSEIITLIFLQNKHLVTEIPVEVVPRKEGKSSVTTMTALETIIQIFNIIMLFSPLRIFLPVGTFLMAVGILWAIPFLIHGNGLSTTALLFITTGLILVMMGLIAEQLAQIRRKDF